MGHQIAEAPRHVLGLSRNTARARALELLRQVGIPDPSAGTVPTHRALRRHPPAGHDAIASSSDPSILLCDEPTTALDVTIQTQILALFAQLRSERGLALVFVTHDLGVVGQVAEDLAVMYTGRIVETGPTAEVLASPRHPYTAGLLAAAIGHLDTPSASRSSSREPCRTRKACRAVAPFTPVVASRRPNAPTEVVLAPGDRPAGGVLTPKFCAASQAVPGRG